MPWTAEQAKQFSRAGWEASRISRMNRPPKEPNQPSPKADDYPARRLKRVRQQLDRLDDMMRSETDPQRLDRLASAQARLSQQEFDLAGRPQPAKIKPSRPGKSGGGPIAAEPE